ncbi:MAG: hypothetical protein N2115_05435, partial [bacterium]|nr:hypothetical protein [bacterium]
IETGRTVIQVSTTGITGFSTPNGNIRMLEKNGQHLLMDGIMEIELPEIIPNSSIYAQIGETGISLAFLILIGICLCRY